MIGVEGFGARELLKVGGRLPGAGGSLRFKVPESTLMDCRRREYAQNSDKRFGIQAKSERILQELSFKNF
jgi:hypothetical protein